jgi:hypothetical protein
MGCWREFVEGKNGVEFQNTSCLATSCILNIYMLPQKRSRDPGDVLWFAVVRSALFRRHATCGKLDVSVIDIRRRLMIKCSDRKT